MEWAGIAFDFTSTSEEAQVVVDLWDTRPSVPPELLGKAVLSVTDCRPGVPHLHVAPLMLGGQLSARLFFDYASELPSDLWDFGCENLPPLRIVYVEE